MVAANLFARFVAVAAATAAGAYIEELPADAVEAADDVEDI